MHEAKHILIRTGLGWPVVGCGLAVLICVNLWLIMVWGCQPHYVNDLTMIPQPNRVARLPIPPGKCTVRCESIIRAQKTWSAIERKEQLLKIAVLPELNLHEQLHLVNVALSLEMFGLDEIFAALARHPYLRYTTKDVLLKYTERLSHDQQAGIMDLINKNPGVPDELTAMEKLWCNYFSLDEHRILDFYRNGFPGADIRLIFYVAYYSGREPEVLGEWRRKGFSWYEIIFDKLTMKADLFFVAIPLDNPIPDPFKRPYELYRILSERGTKLQWLRLTDEEFGQLAMLKVISTYYEVPAPEIMQSIAAGKSFDEIITGLQRKTRTNLK